MSDVCPDPGTESLILDGVGELYQPLTFPMTAPFIGAVDAIPDADLGVPDIRTAAVANLLGDGDEISGDSSGNRQLIIPIIVPGDATTRAAWYRKLAVAVNRRSHVMLWTPAGGLPVAIDCFRGSITRAYSVRLAGRQVSVCALIIPAYPFTRTPDAVVLVPQSAPLLLDGFEATTGRTKQTTPAGTLATTTASTEGTNAVTMAFTLAAGWTATQVFVNKTLPAPVDLSLASQVRVDMKAAWSPSEPSCAYAGGLQIRLTDSGGKTAILYLARGDAPQQGGIPQSRFQTFTANFTNPAGYPPGGGVQPGFDWTSVAAYRVMWNIGAAIGGGSTSYDIVWSLDNLTSMPAFALSTSAEQTVVIPGVPGAYRTAAKLDVTARTTSDALGMTIIHHNPGARPGYDPTAGTGTSFTGRGTAYVGPHEVWVRLTFTGFATGPATVTWTCGGQTKTVTLTAQQINALPGSVETYPYFPLGVVNLPADPGPAENDTATFTVSTSKTNPAGGTVTVNKVYLFAQAGATTIFTDASGMSGVFIDPATPQGAVGLVYVSEIGSVDRADATSNMLKTRGAGTILLAPGDNTITVVAGHLWDLEASFYPRYLAERDETFLNSPAGPVVIGDPGVHLGGL